MIAKMKKLSIVMHASNSNSFIEKLQNLGVVHIATKGKNSEEINSIYKKIKDINFINKEFRKHTKRENQKEYTGSITELLKRIEQKQHKKDNLTVELETIEKNISILNNWGNFDQKLIEKLKENNINISFWKIKEKKFKKLNKKNIQYEVISKSNGYIYFITINLNKISNLEEVKIPSLSLSDNIKRQKEILKELEEIDKRIENLTAYYDDINKKKEALEDKLSYNLVLENSKTETKISTITGWIPEEKESIVRDFLDREDIVYLMEEDNSKDIPVLLKNKKIFSLFEPITKLFDLPAPVELDLTPFFAPFFALFFGLCLGDSGYGLVILVATIILFKFKKNLRSLALLGIILSLCTIFWGLLTGNFFGINLFETDLKIFNNSLYFIKSLATFSSNHVFYLSLIIGIFQILFAMILRLINQIKQDGILAGLSTVGWIFLVFFLIIAYLKNQNPAEGFKIGEIVINFSKSTPEKIQNAGIVIGIALILLFNDTKSNIFLRIGKGIWELYGITGFLGDLLSYIRLFALGVSSAILGAVINSIALNLLQIKIPVVSQLLFIVFLILAHGANLMIASLGAFVHPLRLTFVEFYKNSGFKGGGKIYKPFRKNIGG